MIPKLWFSSAFLDTTSELRQDRGLQRFIRFCKKNAHALIWRGHYLVHQELSYCF